MVRKQSSSPSVRMTLPSCTYTHTPHSTLPQPRQQERMRVTADSVAAAFSFSARAAVGLAAPATAATAADTAAVLTKDRRVMFSLPISSSFSSFGFSL